VLKLNGTLDNLLCANDFNLFEENKHTFCEGSERGALLVTGNDVSLLANVEVKVGKSNNKEGWVSKCFEHLNTGNNPYNSKYIQEKLKSNSNSPKILTF